MGWFNHQLEKGMHDSIHGKFHSCSGCFFSDSDPRWKPNSQEGIKWRFGGVPDYSLTNLKYLEGKDDVADMFWGAAVGVILQALALRVGRGMFGDLRSSVLGGAFKYDMFYFHTENWWFMIQFDKKCAYFSNRFAKNHQVDCITLPEQCLLDRAILQNPGSRHATTKNMVVPFGWWQTLTQKDGEIPSTNLFSKNGVAGWTSRVYVFKFQNPFFNHPTIRWNQLPTF